MPALTSSLPTRSASPLVAAALLGLARLRRLRRVRRATRPPPPPAARHGRSTSAPSPTAPRRRRPSTSPRSRRSGPSCPRPIRDARQAGRSASARCPPGSRRWRFVGDDNKTLTGSEPDLGRWSRPSSASSRSQRTPPGRTCSSASTAAARRRLLQHHRHRGAQGEVRLRHLPPGQPGFEALETSAVDLRPATTRTSPARRSRSGAGTNQEKILLEWQAQAAGRGQGLRHQVLPGQQRRPAGAGLRQDRRLLRPEPSSPTSGAGRRIRPTRRERRAPTPAPARSLQGLIAATAKKDSGLAKPLADAINYLIENGQYQRGSRRGTSATRP